MSARKGSRAEGASQINRLFEGELQCVNMGLESFAENLQSQGVAVLQMAWRPPAGGDARLIGLLARLGR